MNKKLSFEEQSDLAENVLKMEIKATYLVQWRSSGLEISSREREIVVAALI